MNATQRIMLPTYWYIICGTFNNNDGVTVITTYSILHTIWKKKTATKDQTVNDGYVQMCSIILYNINWPTANNTITAHWI